MAFKRGRTENECEREFHIAIDPALRKPINDYEHSIRDDVRRAYVVQGPYQPHSHAFPKTSMDKIRSFHAHYFNDWEWMEYSVSKDGAYCFWCYLFNRNSRSEVFISKEFRNWRHATEKFKAHVGAAGSAHNNAKMAFFAFKDQRQSLARKVFVGNRALETAYRTRLTAVVDVVRLLLQQGLAFRGHNESEDSLNKGNFLEILDWYSSRNLDVGKVMNENAPGNNKLICHSVQKDIIEACGSETRKAIISDIGDKFFSLLVDEARDCSIKEQMAIVLRYVNDHGIVMEHFIGLVHVVDTTSLALKRGIDEFFAKYGLSLSKLRGQGYDGASNMRGELNGLKTLILNENPCARYIHCFAHQLQLVVVAVAQSNQFVGDFFEYLSMITNMVGASCKRKDEFRQVQHEHLVEMLANGEISTGKGLNQETSLVRPGATRWGSHFTTIIRLLSLWPSTIKVLGNIFKDGTDLKTRGVACSLVEKMESYQFVFISHLMKLVLGLTSVLSQFLQKKDQNIIEAVSLIHNTKARLLALRENGWDELLDGVNIFCAKNGISILNMEDEVKSRFRLSRANTNDSHFRIDIYYQVIDRIGQEMENRFSESTTELLTCVGCLDPKNSFSKFNNLKIIRLAELYPQDFSRCALMELEEELKGWIHEMRENEKFSTLQDMGEVARKMAKIGYHTAFPLVYRIIELVLVLPVATSTVERAFSAMKIVKTDLRNKIGDDFLTNCLVCYIEKDVFKSIDNEAIMQYFQNMKTRKQGLPPLPQPETE
ncbi:unnamed protein product [Rhodiola kirilowii]